MNDSSGPGGTHLPRVIGLLALVFVVVTVGWWLVGRLTMDERRLLVRQWQAPSRVEAPGDSASGVRIVAWNLAHGRGDAGPGLFRNWRGGNPELRTTRLLRIAEMVRRLDPDLVVLNEVDFDAHWSGGVNQAEVLARALGYPFWVEQRNYDLRLPFGTLSFGNAVLSRYPVSEALWVPIPPHSTLESRVIGAKGASLVRVDLAGPDLALVPVHLEVRSEATRLSAVPVLDSVREAETLPIVLAGDFNSSPAGWPGASDTTALGALVSSGWNSPRTAGLPGRSQWTYPSPEASRAIDWVLVEPPLSVLDVEVVEAAGALSDHLPVASVIRIGPAPTGDTVAAGRPADGADPVSASRSED